MKPSVHIELCAIAECIVPIRKSPSSIHLVAVKEGNNATHGSPPKIKCIRISCLSSRLCYHIRRRLFWAVFWRYYAVKKELTSSAEQYAKTPESQAILGFLQIEGLVTRPLLRVHGNRLKLNTRGRARLERILRGFHPNTIRVGYEAAAQLQSILRIGC